MFYSLGCIFKKLSKIVAFIVIHVLFFFKIVALNKTKERMRPYQVNQEEDDPDIKKIKKVAGSVSFICAKIKITLSLS